MVSAAASVRCNLLNSRGESPFFLGGNKMTMAATKVSVRLAIQAGNEMTPDFCDQATPQFVDDTCARVSFYSARKALIFRPHPMLKNSLDNNQSFIARLIYNLKKIGVQFERDKSLLFNVAYGHISLKMDAIISSGFPDFPQERGLLFAHVVSGVEFRGLIDSQMPYDGWMVNNAQLLMAYGGFKKAAIFLINRASGETFEQVVDINFKIAQNCDNLSKEAISNPVAPERIIPVSTFTSLPEGLSKKCNSCPYSGVCMLPDSPPPTCYNCQNYSIGPNGSGKCMAQNGFELSIEMRQNMHQCGHHIYMPSMLDSWAEILGVASKTVIGEDDLTEIPVGNHYANKITGAEFFNLPPSASDDSGYSSYEIYGAKGKDLVGDKGIDKLRKVFGAKIQGIDNDISGSKIPD